MCNVYVILKILSISDGCGLRLATRSGTLGRVLVGLVLSLEFSVLHLHIVSGGISGVDLSGSNNLIHGVLSEFVPVSHPAGEARKGEQNGKELWRNVERLVDNAGVEVDVGVELPRDEIVIV